MFAVYDIDTNRRFYYQIDANVAPGQKAQWMDGHRLDLVNNNETEVFEFDGSNSQTLTTNLPGFTPFFDSGYTAVYNISPLVSVPNRYALTQTQLKVTNP